MIQNSRRNTCKGGKLESVWVEKRTIIKVLERGTYKLDGLKNIFYATKLKPVIQELLRVISLAPWILYFHG